MLSLELPYLSTEENIMTDLKDWMLAAYSFEHAIIGWNSCETY